MAIDTADKRASAVHVGLPWRGLLPLPDAAAENQGDRQQVMGLYRGILALASTTPTIFGDLTTLFCHYMEDIRDSNPTKRDTETLIAAEYPTVRSTMHSTDDANTAYAEFLS